MFVGLLAEFVVEKALGAGGAEESSATVNHVTGQFPGSLLDLSIDQPFQTVIDNVGIHSKLAGMIHGRLDRRIHAGGVTARCHNGYSTHK